IFISIQIGWRTGFRAEIKLADWEKCFDHWPLANRVDEVGVRHRNLVHFAVEKLFRAEPGNSLGFNKGRRILQLEIGHRLALGPGDELPGFASSDNKRGFVHLELGYLAEQVC